MLTGAGEKSFGPEAFRADAVVRHRAGPDPATLQEAVMADAYPTPTVVYGLWSTRDRIIRYIGQTSSGLPAARLSKHRSAAAKGAGGAVGEWIRSEVAAGAEIRMKALHWHGDAAISEKEFIALYRRLGAPLLNKTEGADLSAWPDVSEREVSAETRAKLSKLRRGKRASAETRAKLSRAGQRRFAVQDKQADYFAKPIRIVAGRSI